MAKLDPKTLSLLALHFAVILAAPLAALLRVPDVPLYGVEQSTAAVDATWRRWRDGEAQLALQSKLETQLGGRGALVRTDNAAYELLGDAKPGSAVAIGDHRTLLFIDDLWGFTRRPQEVPDLARIRDLADLVADTKTTLAAQGKHLVVIVSPSKTSLYGADVPARWRHREGGVEERGRAPLRAFEEQLERRGVGFTDGPALLRAQAHGDDVERERLFARGARHWTPVGACLVLQTALAALVPGLPCETKVVRVTLAQHWDRDLLRLLNHWEPDREEDSLRPRTVEMPNRWMRPLVVGTSFSWGLLEWLRGASDGPVRFFYYNRSVYEGTPTTTELVGSVQTGSPSWHAFTRDRNVVILEVLESVVDGEYMREFFAALRKTTGR